ncbi:MAG: DedA family protein, partial [Bacteroidetes bacterium]|nr:DedA family protein [Bacteroidota bacterium]
NKFTFYNITGAFLWITSLTLLGFFLGRSFEKEIDDYLLYIIVGFIFITTIPLIVTYLKRKIGGDRRDDEESNP